MFSINTLVIVTVKFLKIFKKYKYHQKLINFKIYFLEYMINTLDTKHIWCSYQQS